MFDENQIVQVRWNNSNKDWYESKGYIFTKRNDFFDVIAKDLMPHSSKKVFAICDYCGEEFYTQYALITNGRKVIQKDCCSHCTGKKASEVSKRKRAIKYIGIARKICEENGYTLLTTEDEYTDIKMNIHFVCPIHGEQVMSLDSFIRGHRCEPCSYEERADGLRHDIEYVKERIESVNGNKWLNPEDYKSSVDRNLNIECSCGNVFTTSFVNYDKHNVNTCFSCSCKESKGEQCIREFLTLNEIDFEQEKRFYDCRDVKPLPFDFYLPQYNLIIEFDGIQHFEEVHNRDYETTKKHDEIKNKYCTLNGIDLLRIPYWQGSNIESIISTKLNL